MRPLISLLITLAAAALLYPGIWLLRLGCWLADETKL